jgi:hypothetical protein
MEISEYIELFIQKTKEDLEEFEKFIIESKLSDNTFSFELWKSKHDKWKKKGEIEVGADFQEIEIYLNDD